MLRFELDTLFFTLNYRLDIFDMFRVSFGGCGFLSHNY